MKKITPFVIAVLILFSLASCGGQKVIRTPKAQQLKPAPSKAVYDVNAKAYDLFVNGSILEAMGEIQSANQQYSEALKYYPGSGQIRYAYASTFMKMRDFRNAITEAEKISPKDLSAWFLLAECYRILGLTDSAVIAYRRVVDLDSNEAEAYYRIGAYYQDKGNLDSALWGFENVARISPSYRVFMQLGNLQMQAGHLDNAEQNYIQSLQLDSTQSNVRSFLGLSAIYENRGDQARAKQYFEAAADRAPQDLMIQNRLLEIYQADREYGKAIVAAKRILALNPDDLNISGRLALAYFEADSLRQSDSIFSALLASGDENILNYYYVSRIALNEQDYERAKSNLIRLTVLADSVVDGWANLGLIYRVQDSVELEIATYETGLKHMTNLSDSSALLFEKGATQEQHGRFAQAVETFERLISLAPVHSQALNYLGYMLADKGIRLEEAQTMIEKALKIMPNNGAYLDSYGWVLFKLGRAKDALGQLLLAYQTENRDPVVAEHIGDVYEAVGDMQNACLFWQKALEINPDNKALREKLRR